MSYPRALVALATLLALPAWPILAAAQQPSQPIHIEAETLTYDRMIQVYVGKGHVVFVQGPVRVEADEAILNRATGQLHAEGHVFLSDGVNDLRGDRMDLDVNTTKGVIFHGRLFVVDGNFTVDGRVMERLSETQYRLEEGSFTSCSVPEGERAPWSFKASKAEVDTEESLFARHARFCILDVPVMYLPAVLFPAKRERSTGVLFPQLGASSKQGFKVRQGFFWAITPSQDATASVDYRGKLGLGGDVEYRYILSRDSSGRLYSRFFRDTQNSVSRWDLIYLHTTKFSEDLVGRVDINYVNRKNTFQVLSENVLQRVAVFQESQAFLTNRWDNQVLYGFGRFSQNLTDTNKTTLQTLPEIGYSLSPARLGGLPLYTGMDVTFDSFYRQEGLDARRGDLFPRVWAPLPVDRYFTVTPLAGFRETIYSRSLQGNHYTSREVPYLSTTVDTRLTRRFSPSGGPDIVHKIEPAVIYEYLPPTREGHIPVFNDLDRLLKKNLLTYTLTNRLSTSVLDGETLRYLEFAYLRLTQSQHLTSSPTGKPYSDLRSELILRTLRPLNTTLDVDVFYNHAESAVSQVNTDVQVELLKRYFFTIGQRYTRAGPVTVRGDLFNPLSFNDTLVQTQTTHFYSASAGVALPYNFYAVVRGYYDRTDGVFPEVNYGLFYVGSDRCWGVGAFLVQRPDQTEYAFVLTLGGVGFTDSSFSALYRSLFDRLGVDIQKLR